jgi:hypothetical protein
MPGLLPAGARCPKAAESMCVPTWHTHVAMFTACFAGVMLSAKHVIAEAAAALFE